MDIASLLIGLAAGAAVAWLALRAGSAGTVARLRAELDAERRNAAEKVALLDEAKASLREAFALASTEALRQNGEAFLQLAQTKLGEFQQQAAGGLEAKEKAIGELVRPLRESLEKVDGKLQEIEKERVGAYAGLTEQVKSMQVTQAQLQSETSNLVRALRAPNVRGRWGEIQLKRVVEMAGMLDHCDFHEQETANGDGGRLRPDLVVRLPGGKNVIVDAKAPLEAYLDGIECTDDARRAECMRRHSRQVRDHLGKLGTKAYWDQFPAAPEFVVMFLPGEMFYSAALENDPALIEHGVEQRVIIASPTTLIALLKAVGYGWRQERIAENATEISALGRTLYERVRTCASHLERLGRSLDQSVERYNDAIGSLERSVLPAARRFKDLGAAASEDIPELEPVDHSTRRLQAPELAVMPVTLRLNGDE